MKLRGNMNLQTKLMAGFGSVALICTLIGLVGWYGANKLEDSIQDTGEHKLPAMQTILSLKEAQLVIKTSERTLLNPTLNPTSRENEYKKIDAAFEQAQTAMLAYESLPQNGATKKVWDNFLTSWDAWKGDIARFLELSKKIDALNIQNPQQLALDVEQNFGAYKTWAAETSKAILEQTEFRGNLDPEQSAFGLWLKSLEVANPDVQEAVRNLKQQLSDVYKNVATIADLLAIEEYALAKDVYVYEVLPSIESIQIYVNRLMKPIREALDYFTQTTLHEREVTAKSLASSENILNNIVEQNNRAVVHAMEQGNAVVQKLNRIIFSAILLGGMAALGLGFFLARSITVPLKKTVQMIEELGKGHLDNRLGIIRNDEIGQVARAMDEMAEKLGAMVFRISDSSQELTAISQNISDSSGRVDASARHQAKEVEETSSAIAEISASVEEVGQGISTLTDSASETTSTVLELSASIEEVAQNAENLADTVEEVGASITEMATSITQIADNTRVLQESKDSTVSSVAQMDASVRQVEEHAKETARITEKVRADVAVGKTSVDATITGINEIRRSSQITGEVVTSLSEQAQNIGSILSVIDDVTDQTNLLALNAAIIAAQAGEHGRGFAVVSDEIRELADRTSLSTREIAKVIRGVQQETQKAVTAIERGEKSIAEGEKLSLQSGEVLNQIVTGIQDVDQRIEKIAQATLEQALGSRTIREAIERISKMVDQTASATSEQKKTADLIIQATVSMNGVTNRVKFSTREQSEASKNIARSMEDVNGMIRKINQACQKQRQESKRIKLAAKEIQGSAKVNLESTKVLKDAATRQEDQITLLNKEMGAFKVDSQG